MSPVERFQLSAMNGHYRFYQLETFFRSISSLGYRSCELWTGPMHFFLDHRESQDPGDLRRLEDRWDVKILRLCPEQTNPKPGNIAAKGEEGIRRTQAYFQRAIELARELGIPGVTITPGWHYLDEPREEALERSARMLRRLSDYAGERGVFLSIECLQTVEAGVAVSVSELSELLTLTQRPEIRVCLDFGAMAAAGETIGDYFTAFPGRIAGVHFVDGAPTGHLAWGDGERDMKADMGELERFGYTGPLSVESVNPRYFQKPWDADRKTMLAFQQAAGKEG